jgi:hypothetical protein
MKDTLNPLRDLAWSTLRRLEFIESRLFWDGRVNRSDLMETFGVSVPQASLDLRQYMERAPGNMIYDKRRKHYYANDKFYPVFITPSAEDYLASLLTPLGCSGGHWFSRVSGFRPPLDVVPMPERRADNQILRALLGAIREKLALEIHYQSLSTETPDWRWIEPHALASDGQRWHVRAYCWNRQAFRDFVIGRITASREKRPGSIAVEMDTDWREWVRVVLAPAPGLPDSQRKIVEYDFGMKNGVTELTVRRALAYYLQQRYGKERQAGSPQARQVVIIGIIATDEPVNE